MMMSSSEIKNKMQMEEADIKGRLKNWLRVYLQNASFSVLLVNVNN